jgi:uncharacterized membrane protein
VNRALYLISGSALMASGLLRKSPLGIALAALGGGIAAVGLNPDPTRSSETAEKTVVQKTVTVTKSPVEAYAYWRKLENLSTFIDGLSSIHSEDGQSHSWKVRSRMGLPVEWKTEITHDQPGHLLEWKSVEGSPIVSSGSVRFKRKQGGRGTKIHVQFSYVPASGFLAEAVNRAFVDKSGAPKLAENLKHLKENLA